MEILDKGRDAETLYHEGGNRHYSNLGNSYPQSLSIENHDSNHHLSQPYAMQNPMQLNHDTHSHGQLNDRSGSQYFHNQDGYASLPSDNTSQMQASRMANVQPPLPTSPPPPLPVDPPGHPLSGPHALSSPAITSSSLFPIAVSSAATASSSYASVAEANSLVRPYFHDRSRLHASTGFATEVWLIQSWLAFVLRHPSCCSTCHGYVCPFCSSYWSIVFSYGKFCTIKQLIICTCNYLLNYLPGIY